MNKTKVKCPRCHSDQLYKFGLDKQANQKYQCKKCNHVIVHHHSLNIDNTSSENLTESLSMKGMRFPLHVILTALTLYFLNNTSTRATAQSLYTTSNIKVSHVTIDTFGLINLHHSLKLS